MVFCCQEQQALIQLACFARMAELVYAHGSGPCAARLVGSNPTPGTRTELKGFFEAEMRDARSAWHISDFGSRCEFGTIDTHNLC